MISRLPKRAISEQMSPETYEPMRARGEVPQRIKTRMGKPKIDRNEVAKTVDRRALRTKSYDMGKAMRLRLVNRLSYAQIGHMLGASETAVRRGLVDLEALLANPELVSAFKDNEAEVIDSARMLAIQAVGEQLADPVRRKKLDISRLTMLFGVLFDKQRLIRGQSTANIKQLSMLITDAHRQRATDEAPRAEAEAGGEQVEGGATPGDGGETAPV